MSVYSELIRVGIRKEEVEEIVEGISHSKNLVTKEDLIKLQLEFEKSFRELDKSIRLSMITMTVIFSGIVTIVAGILSLK